jgi:predicted signal transduction protein with EAL and GGDEF domain
MSTLSLPDDISHTYLFLPLHVAENILGYVLFVDKLDLLFTPDAMYMWTRHLSQDMERVRQNVRMKELNKMLTEVSMTDALTGLKNRAGYDSLAVPYLQKCQREGKLGTMIFADINRMKLINDRYSKPLPHSASLDELIECVKEHNLVPIVDDRGCFIGLILRREVLGFLQKYYKDE